MSATLFPPRRRLGLAALAAAVVAVAGGAYLAASSLPVADPAPPALQSTTAQVEPHAGPGFDVVRVAPGGSAVLAGHAAPGATVTIREGDRTVAEAQADSQGSFAAIATLPPGAGQLSLAARDAAGGETPGQTQVVVMVPERKEEAPLALAQPPAAPSRLLQAPAPGAPGHALALDTVDYGEQGALRFGGSAPPAAPLRVYVDNRPVGEAQADADGHWALSPPGGVAPGLHQLRVDQLRADGTVAARRELPFQREAAVQLAAGQVVVQPRQTLWRIARQEYGAGMRYTVIYLANRDQIRRPELIYPGQVFAVPQR